MSVFKYSRLFFHIQALKYVLKHVMSSSICLRMFSFCFYQLLIPQKKNHYINHLYSEHNFLIIFLKLILQVWYSFSPFHLKNSLKSRQLSQNQARLQKAEASGLEHFNFPSHLMLAMYARCPSLFIQKIIFKQHMALTMHVCPGRFSLKGLQSICQAISHFLHTLPLTSNPTLLTAN